MKKLTRICTLLFALLLVFSLLATTILADDAGDGSAEDGGAGAGAGATTCVGTEKNIAQEAEITTTTDCWTHLWYLHWLVDGDKTTGAGSSHRQGDITTTLTFDESYDFTKLVFTVQSAGRVANDRNLSQVSNKNQNFKFTVKLYSMSEGGDVEEFNQEYSTDGVSEIVVVPDINAKIYKMSVYWWCGWNNGLTFWEWETFVADGHEWQAPETPTVAPTCVKSGLGVLTCANCTETKSSVIPATGHTNTDPCATTCTTCSQTMTATHVYTDACDTECDACTNGARTAPHRAPDNIPCADACADCGATKAVTADHTFANHCTTTCILCEKENLREQTHTWSYDGNTDPCLTPCSWDWCDEPKPHKYDDVNLCAENCLACGMFPRETELEHTYGPIDDDTTATECDTTCNVCAETRIAPHKYEYVCKPLCDICLEINPNSGKLHTFSHDCDNRCDNAPCAYKRKTTHVYTTNCDAVCDVVGCGFTRTVDDDPVFVPNHSFASACDTICDVENCGYTRTVGAHEYTSNCDAVCDVEGCGFTRTADVDPVFVPNHSFTSNCDPSCNIESCGYVRTVPKHIYDSNCDATCNVENCGYTRTNETDPEDTFYPNHRFVEEGQTGEGWIQKTAPSEGVAGEKIRMCLECDHTETREIPALPVPDKGIGAGGVVAIVAGSTVVAGAGGFSIFWFVIKKKSWADLISVFKK